MPNKIKLVDSSRDNILTSKFEDVGTDGSGQSNVGSREFINPNWVEIHDSNSNTRQTHLVSNIIGGTDYTVSVEYKKLEGTPTFRFQIQGYSNGSYVRTIKFTDTAETGIEDVEGWQLAKWTFTLPIDCNQVRLWWQDGADYTRYTHSFQLRNPRLTVSRGEAIQKGKWSIETSPNNTGGGISKNTSLYNGVNIPEGSWAIYYPETSSKAAVPGAAVPVVSEPISPFEEVETPEISQWIYAIVNTESELMGKLAEVNRAIKTLRTSVTGLIDASEDRFLSLSAALDWAKNEELVLVLDRNIRNYATDNLALFVDANNISSFVDTEPTTNLISAYNDNHVRAVNWTNSGIGEYIYNASNNTKPDLPNVNMSKVQLMSGRSVTTGSQHFGCANTSVSPNTTYTMSVYYFQNRAGASQPYFRQSVNNNNLGNLAWNGDTNTGNWPVNQWIRISVTVTTAANENACYMSNYIGRAVDDQVWYCAPMVEQNDKLTPFVDGTRSQGTTWMDLSGGGNNLRINNNPTYSNSAFTINETQSFNHDPEDTYPEEKVVCTNSSDATVAIWYKTTDTQELWLRGQTGSYYIAACHPTSNYYHQSSGSPSYRIDLQGVSNPKSCKQGFYHMFEAKGVDFTQWTQMNWFGYGSSWNMNGTVAKIMVYDKRLTDAESEQNYFGGSIISEKLSHLWDAGNLVSFDPEQPERAFNLAKNDLPIGNEESANGTLVNGVEYHNEFGGHWRFDGSDDHILLDGSPGTIYLNGNVDWTASAWIRTTNAGSGIAGQPILSNSASGPVYSNLKIHGGVIGYSHYNSGWLTGVGTIPVADGEWHHLTWVNHNNGGMTEATMDLYVDGVFDKTIESGLSSNNRIDVLGGSWGAKFAGDIACAQINKTAFSATNVKDNFNAFRSRFSI